MVAKIDPEKTALLVIDMQNDFFTEGFNAERRGKHVKQMQKLPDKINGFAAGLRERGVKIVFTKFVYDPQRSPTNYSELVADTRESNWLCAVGTKGAELAGMEAKESDEAIEKLYYDSFAGTDLLQKLKGWGIENVIVTGVRTEICVLATAERAFSEGFRVFTVSDLVGTYDDRELIGAATCDALQYVGHVLKSDEVKELLT